MSERCSRTVAIHYPCVFREGHEGLCQPSHEDQLRVYGLKIEDIKQIQRDLAEAKLLGILGYDDKPTIYARYLRLRAALERGLDYEQAMRESEA